MGSHVDCIACIVNKANILADLYMGDKQQKHLFLREVLAEILATEFERSAPYIEAKMTRIACRITGVSDFYAKDKQEFNQLMLSLEQDVAEVISLEQDPLFEAMKAALAGNIIDFSALPEVSPVLVKETLFKTLRMQNLDYSLYTRLVKELGSAKNLLYLGDNAGEIVMDKIFLRELKQRFPHVSITFATRAKPISSDITEADAYQVGIDGLATVINNGTDLPGTDLLEVSEPFLEVFHNADIIISKGQGNFETLTGSGKNIYYLFLCKCDVFTAMLKVGKLTPVFLAERQR